MISQTARGKSKYSHKEKKGGIDLHSKWVYRSTGHIQVMIPQMVKYRKKILNVDTIVSL